MKAQQNRLYADVEFLTSLRPYRNFRNLASLENVCGYIQVYQLMHGKADIDVQVIHFPGQGTLAGLSDQLNYWRFGYPALMLNDTSFVRNPHDHQVTDTIDTLDFEKMTAVVNATCKAVINMR